MKKVRVILLITVGILVIFPGILGSQGSVVFSADRSVYIPTSPENDGIIGIQEPSSVRTSSTNEKLVDIENRLTSDQNVTISLENGLSWQFSTTGTKQQSKIISPSGTKSYLVDTGTIGASQGEYTIVSRNGSFLFQTSRNISFEQVGGINATIGGDTGKALIDIGDTDGEVVKVDGSFIYPSGPYSLSSNDTSVVALNEANNCGGNKNQGNCPIYAQPQGTGSAKVTITDSNGNSDVVIVKVTSSPFFVEFGQIQQPTEGNGNVKINAKVTNNGSQTRDVDVRVNPQFAPPKSKTYTGIDSGGSNTKEFSFTTQQGDSGTYTATAETFEVGDVGGFLVDDNSTTYKILSSQPGLTINQVQLNNTQQEVNESETIIFSIKLENKASNSVTDTVSIGNASIGSNSTQVTVTGQTKFIELEIPTVAGDRGQYAFEASTSSNRKVQGIDILRSVPFVGSFNSRQGIGGNRQVNHTFQMSSVNNQNLDDVRLRVKVDGTEEYNRLIVENGQEQLSNFSAGSIQVQNQQIQTNSPVSVQVATNLNQGGGGRNVKSIITVTQSDGFQKTNVTSFQS